jgi:ABC-type Co2+ transport system permease subunit
LSWLLETAVQSLPAYAIVSLTDSPGDLAAALLLHPVIMIGLMVIGLFVAALEYRLNHAPEFPVGLLIGQVAVLATALLNCAVLVWGAQDDWHKAAQVVFLAHLPVAAVEGVVLGFTVSFLARVKPEMLHGVEPKETECLAESVP